MSPVFCMSAGDGGRPLLRLAQQKDARESVGKGGTEIWWARATTASSRKEMAPRTTNVAAGWPIAVGRPRAKNSSQMSEGVALQDVSKR